MSADEPTQKKNDPTSPTRFFLKGLAISLPPILTLVILIWVGNAINDYIIQPINLTVQYSIAYLIDESKPTGDFVTWDRLPSLDKRNRPYRITSKFQDELQGEMGEFQVSGREPTIAELDNYLLQLLRSQLEDLTNEPEIYVPFGEWSVPFRDFEAVAKKIPPAEMPATSNGLYMELVTIRYFGSQFLLIAGAVSVLIILLYFLGRIVTARVGAWVVHKTETVFLAKVPLISHVYSSVKQVTDFFFSERTVEYNRVVALEYPRRGLWSIGFVTSDSMLEMTVAAGEPLVSVLMPTSPMPMTGFTVNVPRSEVIDLNITIDQAFQYCLSCGVLIPEQQKVSQELLQKELARRLTGEDDPAKKSDQQQPSPPPQPTLIEDSPKDSP
ncbi:MAG: DUF502 domain-containing protein [Planctomycetes bacterium]|nr:DUF502 domain-containing protein [Planctomycetota bacterium]